MVVADPKAQTLFQNIMVAIDFSSCSKYALRYALGVGRRYGARVYIVHAVHSMGYYLAGAGVLPQASEQAERDAQRLETELIADGSLDGIRYEFIVNIGLPWEVLSQVAESKQADLIVLGTHGRRGLKKLLLGSCAEEVFRSATCPVLTVGPRFCCPRDTATPNRILFPTDLSPRGKGALLQTMSLASRYSATLTVLHVIPEITVEAAHDRTRVLESMKLRVRDWLAASELGSIQPELKVCTGDPAESILNLANHIHAKLIIMPVDASATREETLRWPVAYKVVCEAECPVLTVREEAEAHDAKYTAAAK